MEEHRTIEEIVEEKKAEREAEREVLLDEAKEHVRRTASEAGVTLTEEEFNEAVDAYLDEAEGEDAVAAGGR